MRIAGATRGLLWAGVVFAFVGYLVIVDLGMNAGRVHRGVDVDGIAVGGMTLAEAQDRLEEEGEIVRRSPVVFSAEGYDCRAIPGRLGWRARPTDTARAAYEVGRRGGLALMAEERLRSWTGGFSVSWRGTALASRVDAWVARCVRRGEAFGVEVDGTALEAELVRAMDTWPRDQIYELPVEGP